MILAIRTDKPEAELYLLSIAGKTVADHKWLDDRELANMLLRTIDEFMALHKVGYEKLTGIIVYEGPGSFTGLRIGVTVANTIAYSQNIPIVASAGESWLKVGYISLSEAKPGKYVSPEYGSPANISKPKK